LLVGDSGHHKPLKRNGQLLEEGHSAPLNQVLKPPVVSLARGDRRAALDLSETSDFTLRFLFASRLEKNSTRK
jgi:hypothetical protein